MESGAGGRSGLHRIFVAADFQFFYYFSLAWRLTSEESEEVQPKAIFQPRASEMYFDILYDTIQFYIFLMNLKKTSTDAII